MREDKGETGKEGEAGVGEERENKKLSYTIIEAEKPPIYSWRAADPVLTKVQFLLYCKDPR